MPSTYTVNLGIEKPATGEQSGTWGDTTNTNFDILDQAINGAVRVTLTSAGTSGSPNQLQITNGAASDGRNKWIEIYSASDLGGSAYLQLDPNDAEKILFIRNSLAGSQSILLFQGTYDAARDLEVPAGVDMVVKFDGGGASAATVTDVYTKLRVTELTTPTLTATTADINGGTLDNSVIGGTTAAAITGTTIVANTSLNIAGDGATVTGIKDEDDMSSNSPTKLATQQSIKAYVDSQVGTVDTWAEVLANGATSGSTNPEITAGQALKTNTINETSAGSGVTIDSVLLKDDSVNAATLEVSTLKANDGTSAGSIADTTGVVTIASSVLSTVDINGGSIDGTNIGDNSPAQAAFTTGNFTGQVQFNGTAGIQLDNGAQAHTWVLDDNFTSHFNIGTSSSAAAWIFGSNNANYWTVSPSGVIVNQDGADTDFRVESDTNTHALFVDAGNSRVGINTTPSYTVHALSAQSDAFLFSSSHATTTNFYINNTNATTNNTANLYFSPANAVAGAYIEAKALEDFSVSANRTASLEFVTRQDGNWYERLNLSDTATVFNEGGRDTDFRVESDSVANMLLVDAANNRVGVGTGNPQYTFVVSNSGAEGLEISAGGISANRQNIISYNRSTSAYNTLWIDSSEMVLMPPGGGGGNVLINSSDNHVSGRLFVNGNIKAGYSNEISMQYNVSGSTDQYHKGMTGTSPETTSARGLHLFNFDNDSDEGIKFYSGAPSGTSYQKVHFQAGQTGAIVFNENSYDQDFRVESDGLTHALFVDAGINSVAVGGNISNSNYALNVASNQRIVGATTSLFMDSTNDGSGSHIGTIDVNTNSARGSHIALTDNDGVQFGIKRDYNSGSPITRASIYTDNGTTEKPVMTFDYDGVTIFNEDSYDQDFRVESDSNTHALFVEASKKGIAINDDNTQASGFDTTIKLGGAASGGGLVAYVEEINVTNGSYIDVNIGNSSINYWTGMLGVNCSSMSNGSNRTQSLISILANNQFPGFNTSVLHTADGTSARSFTVTYVATGTIRITNTSGDTVGLSAWFTGGGTQF